MEKWTGGKVDMSPKPFGVLISLTKHWMDLFVRLFFLNLIHELYKIVLMLHNKLSAALRR